MKNCYLSSPKHKITCMCIFIFWFLKPSTTKSQSTSMGAQTDWVAKDLQKLMFNIWLVAFCLISYQETCVYTKLVASIYFENSFKT